jgi:hypothetical protein
MNALALLQQTIVAEIRDADATSRRDLGADRDHDDALRLTALAGGTDPRVAEVLAWAARMPAVFDAIAQVAQAARLRQQLADRGVEVTRGT